MTKSTNPYLTTYKQFYKLAGSGEQLEDYADRQMFVTPFGAFKKEGFVAVIDGSNGTLFCLKTDNDYWKGLFYDGEGAKVVFDTAESKQSKDALSFATALFNCLEKEHCVERVSDQQFSMSETWESTTKFDAHWVGS